MVELTPPSHCVLLQGRTIWEQRPQRAETTSQCTPGSYSLFPLKFPIQPPLPKGAALGTVDGEEKLQEQPRLLGLPA